MIRHFLTLMDLSSEELLGLVHRGIELKAMRAAGRLYEPLKNRVLAMVFEKSSTRTRVSFEAAMAEFGGQAMFLSPRDTQLGRGEPVEDTARVLSRMVHAIMVRTYEHEKVELLADYSSVPVINGLTDLHHPCQLLADMQTYHEHRGPIKGRTVAWIGDGNNMCNSYIHATRQYGFTLRIASPQGYDPEPDVLAEGTSVEVLRDPMKAAADADLVVTDVWASMGQEDEARARQEAFAGFEVNEAVMAQAKSGAVFMHCLPAHRGEEVSAGVIESPQSVVWDEAGNRLHAQKALLEFLLAVAPASAR
ncbi:MAG: Ornithine carbamoyltransferase, anabolic [Gammaproteobacteria bacterium]|nr:Ornithine carbamoyltransferase, anabolic [Gammaproteobacteria bacterium]